MLSLATHNELGTEVDSVVRKIFPRPSAEVGVSFKPTDLADIIVGETDS